MIKNKGVTGLGSLPFSSYVDLVQTLNSNGTAVTSEVVDTHIASTGTADSTAMTRSKVADMRPFGLSTGPQAPSIRQGDDKLPERKCDSCITAGLSQHHAPLHPSSPPCFTLAIYPHGPPNPSTQVIALSDLLSILYTPGWRLGGGIDEKPNLHNRSRSLTCPEIPRPHR
jgi:hypothetical protein